MMSCQQAVLGELRSGIHILQDLDNQIISEAAELISGIWVELDAQSKRITDASLANFAQKVSIQALQSQ
jgi:hypothetical protein